MCNLINTHTHTHTHNISVRHNGAFLRDIIIVDPMILDILIELSHHNKLMSKPIPCSQSF